MNIKYLFFGVLALIISCQQSQAPEKIIELPAESELRMLSPVDRYGDLFVDVMIAEIFSDDKTFADAIPKYPTTTIIENYQKQKKQADFDLKQFVDQHFTMPTAGASGFETDFSRTIDEHINALWPVLTRDPDAQDPGTLVPLPEPYIVPGGRFGEIYYWDSYFTMLGLEVSGKVDMIEHMIDNFSYLIDTIGFIPNGNRTYFLTRSQPPFYAAMVNLFDAANPQASVLPDYMIYLEKEYAFWMDGLEEVPQPGQAAKHVVRMSDGSILNRYYDRSKEPRAEMYQDDIELAESTERSKEQLYSDLRAACESGWDFSSRWLADPMDLATIRTTEIIPVDLNALMYNLEQTLAKGYLQAGEDEQAAVMSQKAEQRKAAILNYCWSEERQFFMDYHFTQNAVTDIPSLAGLYPLFFSLATEEQAASVAQMVQSNFLQFGGVVSTLETTGQQWDAPNGWAPLQFITVMGLKNYGHQELAAEIADRWVSLNKKVYQSTGKMVEKYNVMDEGLEAGGGEYPLQDGFGWTNGVLLRLMQEFPEAGR